MTNRLGNGQVSTMMRNDKYITKCPNCGEKVKWTYTDRGTKVAIDLTLVAIQQNIKGGAAIITPDGKLVIGSLAMAGAKDSIQGYTSHASTCRNRRRV